MDSPGNSWMRHIILIAAIALLAMPQVLVYALDQGTADLKVGVVATEGGRFGYAAACAGAIQEFYGSERMRVVTISGELDISALSNRTYEGLPQYLASAIEGSRAVRDLKKSHGLDLLVIVTPEDIYAPPSDILVAHSSAEDGCAVLSYARLGFASDDYPIMDEAVGRRLDMMALHEAGHLLGYSHTLDRSLMRSYPLGTDPLDTTGELSMEDEAELGYRLAVAPVVYSAGFSSWLVLQLAFALVLLPYAAAVVLLLTLDILRHGLLGVRPGRWFLPLCLASSLFMFALSNYAFAFLAPLVVLAAAGALSGWKAASSTPRATLPALAAVPLALTVLFLNSLLAGGGLTLAEEFLVPQTIGNAAATAILIYALAYLLIGERWLLRERRFQLVSLACLAACAAASAFLLSADYAIPLAALFSLSAALWMRWRSKGHDPRQSAAGGEPAPEH